jgi:predicted NBD/HSP70 family sugar kinase
VKHIAGSSRLLRALNETAALGHLLERGPLTRGQLRELTGLAKPTASEVIRRLQDAGLVRVVGRTSGGPGPNAEVYAVNPDAGYAAAVSVRVDALAVAICDLTGEVRATVAAEVDFAATDPVDAVAEAVRRACRQARIGVRKVDHVQVGVPGSYDPGSDTIRYVDVPGWSRPGLCGEIGRRLRTRVRVDNDVNLAATAERRHGVAADHDSFALLWLGEEGLGLAIDLGGTLLRGARGGAGEIGYMPVGLEWTFRDQSVPVGDGSPGLARSTGRGDGGKPAGVPDFQDLVGGPGVQELGSQYGFAADTGHEAVAAAVAALTSEDLAKARTFLDALAVRIAVGLAAVVAVLDPSLVVLAGEVGLAGAAPLRDAVAAALRDLSVLETSVAATGVDDDPVLVGALDASLSEVRATLLGRAGTRSSLTARTPEKKEGP